MEYVHIKGRTQDWWIMVSKKNGGDMQRSVEVLRWTS